eukprot:scaffold58530_cov35-Tisochrysis_lutea.AAC.1
MSTSLHKILALDGAALGMVPVAVRAQPIIAYQTGSSWPWGRCSSRQARTRRAQSQRDRRRDTRSFAPRGRRRRVRWRRRCHRGGGACTCSSAPVNAQTTEGKEKWRRAFRCLL